MKIGYARVSTRDQHPEAQRDALAAAGCDQVFIDKASGKLARRPELDKALLVTRTGDQLVVTKLDRLGRSLEHLIALSTQLQARGVDLVVLDQGIDTSTAVGRMFFQILGAIAEFEHALMSERTLDGLEAARARGRTGGQKPKLGPRQVRMARQMYDELGEDGKRRYTVAQIADEFGVTRPTIYRHLGKSTTATTSSHHGGSAAHSADPGPVLVRGRAPEPRGSAAATALGAATGPELAGRGDGADRGAGGAPQA
jgi:DNA invertase Pin-like site-specific DNA recombinase